MKSKVHRLSFLTKKRKNEKEEKNDQTGTQATLKYIIHYKQSEQEKPHIVDIDQTLKSIGPEGSPCTPLRALWEWCNIVHWSPLITNQDVNTRYLGSHPPFLMVSAVGYVSGYRCVSDCRSRGREFDPGPVPYFRGDWS